MAFRTVSLIHPEAEHPGEGADNGVHDGVHRWDAVKCAFVFRAGQTWRSVPTEYFNLA